MKVTRKSYPMKRGNTVSRRTGAVNQDKVDKVMGEFKRGNLRSSSGENVTNPTQAVAISLSEGRRAKRK